MPQARVRVMLDGFPSAWLPIATCRNGPNGEWDPPEIDEQVIVVAPSGTTAGAYVLGTLPRDIFPVHDYAERNPARHLRWYEDDTTLLYDREQHLWELKNPNADGRHHLLITDNSEIEQTNEPLAKLWRGSARFVASGDAASAILRGCCGIAWYSAAAERFWVTSGKPMAALPRNGGKALMSCLGANALR